MDVLQTISNMSLEEHEKLINTLGSQYENKVQALERTLRKHNKADISRALINALQVGIAENPVALKNEQDQNLAATLFNILQDLSNLVLQAIILEGKAQINEQNKGESNEQTTTESV